MVVSEIYENEVRQRYAPFVREIRLVVYENNDHVVPPLGADVVYPFRCRHERLAVCCACQVSAIAHKARFGNAQQPAHW